MFEDFSKSWGENIFSGHWMQSMVLSLISSDWDITYKSQSRKSYSIQSK